MSDWFGVTTDSGRVTGVSLPGNALSGPLPAAMGDLAKLQSLDWGGRYESTLREWFVQHAERTDPGKALGGLTNLTSLSLSNNQVSGPIPDTLGGLTSLRELHLRRNQLSGPIPEALGNPTNLTSLSSRQQRVERADPGGARNPTNLTSLRLGNNQLSGPIPEALGSLTNLTSLSLDGRIS